MPLFTLNSLSIISIEDSYPDSWRLFPEKAIFVESIGKVFAAWLECQWGTWSCVPTTFIEVLTEINVTEML